MDSDCPFTMLNYRRGLECSSRARHQARASPHGRTLVRSVSGRLRVALEQQVVLALDAQNRHGLRKHKLCNAFCTACAGSANKLCKLAAFMADPARAAAPSRHATSVELVRGAWRPIGLPNAPTGASDVLPGVVQQQVEIFGGARSIMKADRITVDHEKTDVSVCGRPKQIGEVRMKVRKNHRTPRGKAPRPRPTVPLESSTARTRGLRLRHQQAAPLQLAKGNCGPAAAAVPGPIGVV